MVEEIKRKVSLILANDNSGHGMNHINRVLDLSLRFAEKEQANKEITALIALLHDVDDYKLFGLANAKNLPNARKIMQECGISKSLEEEVCRGIASIGYSKRLEGLVPSTLESKIVSDADMCDASGANGILRAYTYSLKKGQPFFDRQIFPKENFTVEYYRSDSNSSSVCHIFEKILKLKNMMLTQSGKEEAVSRQQIVVDFLYHLFAEENAFEWITYLDNYLKKYNL